MSERPGRWAICGSCWVLWVPMLVATSAAGPTADNVHGALSRIDGVQVLRVWGTSAERGYAQGYLLGPEIVSLLDGYIASDATGGSEGFNKAVAFATTRMKVGQVYEEELRGLLTGMGERSDGQPASAALGRPLQYHDLLALNCIPDLGLLGCSSFAAWGDWTTDGKTVAGRNLDWAKLKPLIERQVVIAHLASPGGVRLGWVSVTWPGLIGCLTGMNSEGVTLSLHNAPGGVPPTGETLTPRVLAAREAIESARSGGVDHTIARILRRRASAVGNNVVVSTPYNGIGAPSVIFEYDGVLGDGRGVTVRRPDTPGFQVCTNHYLERAKPIPCDRYATIEQRLRGLADRKGSLDVEQAWDILASVARPTAAVPGLLTYYSVVFEPNRRMMHIAFSKDGAPAPECKRVTLNVAALLTADR